MKSHLSLILLVTLMVSGCAQLLGLDEDAQRLEGAGGSDVTCKLVSDCDGANPCTIDSCDLVVHVCQHVGRANGLAPPQFQIAGDCERLSCEDSKAISDPDDDDTPAADNECSVGVCSDSGPQILPLPEKTTCPLGVCDGQGNCVECVDAAQCTMFDTCGVLEANKCGCEPLGCVDKTCGEVDNGCGGVMICDNATQDGTESDVDCGGNVPTCVTRCANGRSCNRSTDCEKKYCASGVCDDPWGKGFGDEGTQSVAGIASDSDGNVFVTGTFKGSLNLGGPTLTSPSSGGTSMFVAKLNANGTHVWSKSFGDEGETQGSSIAVDSGGVVIVTGWVKGAIQLPKTGAVKSSTPRAFVITLNNAGDPGWDLVLQVTTPPLGGQGNSYIYDVAIGESSSIVLVGVVSGTVSLGGGDAELVGDLDGDGFLLALNSSGLPMFSFPFLGTGKAVPKGVAVGPIHQIAVVGHMSGAVDLGNGIVASEGNSLDAFLVKLNSAGTHQLDKRYGDSLAQFATDVVFDSNGAMIMVGEAQGQVDFGKGPKNEAGNGDVFVAKLTSATGQEDWAYLFGDNDPQTATAVAVDSRDDVYLVGYFAGMLLTNLHATGNYDAFALGLDAELGYVFAKGGFGDTDAQYGRAVAVTPFDATIIAGDFWGTINFGTGILNSSGEVDFFIATFQ